MELLTILEEAFLKARKYLITTGYKDTRIVQKNPGGDQTKLFDITTEKILTDHFKKHLPGCNIIAEETGETSQLVNPDFTLVIDPVDGSFNFSRGITNVGCSIAVVEGRKLNLHTVEAGLVGNFMTGDIFKAQKGQGAYLNNKRIFTSSTAVVSEAVLGIDLDFDSPIQRRRIKKCLEAAKYIRRVGAASLELCYVASGAYDAYVDVRGTLRPENFFAAKLMIIEAGGIFTDGTGRDISSCEMTRGYSVIAAGNKKLHQVLLKMVG